MPGPTAIPGLIDAALIESRASSVPVASVWSDIVLPAVQAADTQVMADYAGRLSDLVMQHKCNLVCAYKSTGWDAPALLKVMSVHPMVLAGSHIQPNPFFEQPAGWLSRPESGSGIAQQQSRPLPPCRCCRPHGATEIRPVSPTTSPQCWLPLSTLSSSQPRRWETVAKDIVVAWTRSCSLGLQRRDRRGPCRRAPDHLGVLLRRRNGGDRQSGGPADLPRPACAHGDWRQCAARYRICRSTISHCVTADNS